MKTIIAKRWFQKSYGNTYHSCEVKEVGKIDYRYGYGDHYLNTAAELLGISEADLRKDIRNNPADYTIVCVDVDRKKDL